MQNETVVNLSQDETPSSCQMLSYYDFYQSVTYSGRSMEEADVNFQYGLEFSEAQS